MAKDIPDPDIWQVDAIADYQAWWLGLAEGLQDEIAAIVEGCLEIQGPRLGRPYADTLKESRHENMKELRVQYQGDPWRIFFAFDPRRHAILLIGGCKSGDPKFYKKMIPKADDLYDAHLETLKKAKK